MRRISILLVVAAASQLGATDCGDIIQDPGFDHWCGELLCYWKVERGEIQRVPTWHHGDDGAELVGDDVAISQVTAVDSSDTDCIRFELLADIDDTAEVRLEADVFDDGTVDWSERIPTSAWEQQSFLIGLRGSYEGIKFRITKVGAGHAAVAQIEARVAADGVQCPTFVDVAARPVGALCAADADCAGGMCNAGVCSSCMVDGDCVTGEVCGREAAAPGNRLDWHTCIPAASRRLGELCFDDGECTSGTCGLDFCGECGDDVTCPVAGTCASLDTPFLYLCDTGARPSGEPCVLDSQCASGACLGPPLGFCETWLPYPCYDDGQCPVGGDLSPGTCTFVAVSGGTCQ